MYFFILTEYLYTEEFQEKILQILWIRLILSQNIGLFMDKYHFIYTYTQLHL